MNKLYIKGTVVLASSLLSELNSIECITIKSSEVPEQDRDEFLANLEKGAQVDQTDAEEKAEIEKETEAKMQELGSFPEIAPYRPRKIPFDTFKHKCSALVQSVVERAGYDPERLHLFMPPCAWKDDDKDAVAAITGGSGSGSTPSGSGGNDFQSGQKTCDMLLVDLKNRLMSMKPHSGDLPPPDKEEETGDSGSGPTSVGAGSEVTVAQPVDEEKGTSFFYQNCRLTGSSPSRCKKAAHTFSLKQSMNRAIEARRKKQTPGSGAAIAAATVAPSIVPSRDAADTGDETGTVFDWCNVVYNVMKTRKLRQEVRHMIEDEHLMKEQKEEEMMQT